MITACIPSRGLIHSRTIESVLRETANILFTHNLPIPDCFNYFIDNAEGDLWFIEEDMLIPPGTLQKLKDLNVDIATADYLLRNKSSVVRNFGKYIYGGTGCTLIKRHVFNDLRFRADHLWLLGKTEPRKTTEKQYGKHDVDFYIRAQQLGYTVGVLDEPVGHLELISRGELETNHGFHNIKEVK